MTRIGKVYALTLPTGGAEDKESFTDLHGGGSCEITRQGRTVSKTQNTLCGFPLPWFYPVGMIPVVDSRILQIQSSVEAHDIVLTITPSAHNLAVRPNQTAKLFIDSKRGTLDSYVYNYSDAVNAAHMLTAVVTYEHYRQFHGLLLPQKISRSVDGGTPLVLSIDSVEVVSQ